MKEKEALNPPIDRLELAELKQGDVLHITLGTDEAAFQYTFTVETPGEWPEGYIVEASPDGRINEGAFVCTDLAGGLLRERI